MKKSQPSIREAIFGNRLTHGLWEVVMGNGKPGLLNRVARIEIYNKIIIGGIIAILIQNIFVK